MSKYTLKTKLGESIAYTNADNLFEAQTNFAKIKVLEITDLIQIFIIEKVAKG